MLLNISGFVYRIAVQAFYLSAGHSVHTGTIRDIYLEKKYYNAVLILAIIATEGLFYHIMVGSTVIPSPYFGCYSMVAVPIGGSSSESERCSPNGCVTSTLVKVGDGRIIGILSLIVFATTEYFTNKWIF